MGLEAARAHLITSLRREINDIRIIEVMMRVPRECFVPEKCRSQAYEDNPLSIGYGQTISQPLIVALMTQALDIKSDEKVLELGTGSGYQTAILAELARTVITVERIPQLLETARKTLSNLGYKNIEMLLAANELGYPKEAPYDAILVTAGAPNIPDILLDQLKCGGRLVIPVGLLQDQKLLKVTKTNGEHQIQNLCGCRFVPLIGNDAWPEEQ